MVDDLEDSGDLNESDHEIDWNDNATVSSDSSHTAPMPQAAGVEDEGLQDWDHLEWWHASIWWSAEVDYLSSFIDMSVEVSRFDPDCEDNIFS